MISRVYSGYRLRGPDFLGGLLVGEGGSQRAGLGGRSPGVFDSFLPWPNLIPGSSTTSASLKPLCQGLLPPSGVGVQPLFEGQVMVQRKPGLRVGPGGV